MPKYVNYLASLTRRDKVVVQLVLDAAFVFFAMLLAMLLRFDGLGGLAHSGMALTVVTTVVLSLVGFRALGLYQALVRYVTGRVLLVVGRGAALSAVILCIASVVFGADLPIAVVVLHGVFVFLLVGGVRFVARRVFRNPRHMRQRPVVIYGAGEAGLQLLNSLTHGREYVPVAMVDDDEALQNLIVGGRKVFAPSELPRIARETGARDVLLAIPSLHRARRREIVETLEKLKFDIKTIPGVAEIVTGKAKISELRNVTPEDLLGRDPVAPDAALLRQDIAGKVVMVSGAGGSIGSELCRQILNQGATMLILYEVSEFALYSIESELTEVAALMDNPPRIVPILGSVQHVRRLEAAIRGFGVQTIYHAAAYKHVPLVEENVVEGVRNNVFGTLAISNAAKVCGVENFILISTDKAVRPTNVMGATKRIAELICQAQAKNSPDTVFSMVRFGNVLGSSGSVIPRFRAQIERGGPITVTHRDINRYFMTIPEASQLVIQAGAMAKGGDVFVLDMGEPVKILDLAMSMVKLHGLVPYVVDEAEGDVEAAGDIPIHITGLRKGEKLYEELLIGNDPASTRHPRIMTASEVSLSMDDLQAALDRLLRACEGFDLPGIQGILHELPLDYQPRSTQVADLLWIASQE